MHIPCQRAAQYHGVDAKGKSGKTEKGKKAVEHDEAAGGDVVGEEKEGIDAAVFTDRSAKGRLRDGEELFLQLRE